MELDRDGIEDAADADGGIGNIGDVKAAGFQLLDKGADRGGFTRADFAGDQGNATAVDQLVELAEQLFNLF